MSDLPLPALADTSLEDELHNLMQTAAPQLRAFMAEIVKINGNLTVPTRPGYVYIQMPSGAVIQVFNSVTAPDDKKQVIVGYSPYNPSLLQVLSSVHNYRSSVNPWDGIGPHAATHMYLSPQGGNDPVWIIDQQFLPLKVEKNSGGNFMVDVFQAVVNAAGIWYATSTTPINLAGYVPASGYLYALIYISTTGAISVRVGAASPLFAFSVAKIPPVYNGERALAAVRLYTGQAAISMTPAVRDITDLRFSGVGIGGGRTDRLFRFRSFI